MTWSFNAIGQVENLCKALDEYGTSLGTTGQSAVEFAAVAPLIKGLAKQNFQTRPGLLPVVVEVQADGHGSSIDGTQIDRQVSVSVKPNYTRLV